MNKPTNVIKKTDDKEKTSKPTISTNPTTTTSKITPPAKPSIKDPKLVIHTVSKIGTGGISSQKDNKDSGLYLSTTGNNEDFIDIENKPTQTPKGTKINHLRTTDNLKGDSIKLKKEPTNTPFNSGLNTAAKPSNPLRQSIKNIGQTDKEPKEFDIHSSNKKSLNSSTVTKLTDGNFNTQTNSEQNLNSNMNNSTTIDRDTKYVSVDMEESPMKTENRKQSITEIKTNKINLKQDSGNFNTSNIKGNFFIFLKLIIENNTEESKNSLIQKENEINLMKNFVAERKQLNDQISLAKKDAEKARREYEKADKLCSQYMTELEQVTNSLNTIILEKESLEGKIVDYSQENDNLTSQISELKDKISELDLDLELKTEENRIIQEEFDAFKEDNLNAKKENYQPDSSEYKLIELDNQNKILRSSLLKLSDDKKIEIELYKKQIEDLKLKNKALEGIASKDEEIRVLKEKNSKYEQAILDLKEQINAFSASADLLDQMVMEKLELENEIYEIKEDNNKLKEDLQTTDELIEEYENYNKDSMSNIRKKEDEIIRLTNHIKMLNDNMEESEKKQKKIIDLFNHSNSQIKILKEELSKKNNDVNVDDILNTNNSVNSKIRTLERQVVLRKINFIEANKNEMKSKIIFKMIPKKIFTKVSFESFERFLFCFSLKKKTLNLIFNILENDLLDKERDIISINEWVNNLNKENEFELENSKSLITFLSSLLMTLIDFYLILQKIEIFLANLSPVGFKESENAGFWNMIFASAQFIENLIHIIKDDNFSIKYQFEGLRSISNTIQDEFKRFKNTLNEVLNKKRLNAVGSEISSELSNFNIIFEENEYPIMEYFNQILYNLFYILLNTKKEKKNIYTKNKSKVSEIIRELNSMYNLAKKNILKIEDKFLINIPYTDSKKIFEFENTYFLKIKENKILLEKPLENEDTESNEFDKYNFYAESLNKVFVYLQALIEKYEKDKEKEISAAENLSAKVNRQLDLDEDLEKDNEKGEKLGSKYNPILPVSEWNEICNESYMDLESNIKIKDSLDMSLNNLKNQKLENYDLKNQINELKINKTNYERIIAENYVIVGKVPQLQQENENLKKKIEKYETTSENLINQLESEKKEINILKTKLEDFQKNPQPSTQPRGRGTTNNNQRSSLMTNDFKSMTMDSMHLLNTICQLQRERKLLKTKLVKDKFISIINTEESYVNKLINIFQKKDAENDIEIYEKIEDQLDNITEKYNSTRVKLAKPKIFDLTEKDYDYNKFIKSEINKTTDLRLGYLKDIDFIFSSLFSDHALDKSFKNTIDNDIANSIQYFGEPRLLVGKISIKSKNKRALNDEKSIKDVIIKGNNEVARNTQVLPMYLSERALKYLNKSFMC